MTLNKPIRFIQIYSVHVNHFSIYIYIFFFAKCEEHSILMRCEVLKALKLLTLAFCGAVSRELVGR
jgi:hypothetical protein